MAAELIIQLQSDEKDFQWHRLVNFPSRYSAYIVFSYTDNPASRQMAIDLSNSLIAALATMDCTEDVNYNANGPNHNLDTFHSTLPRENIKLLVIVSDGNSAVFSNDGIPNWKNDVLPVIKAGATVLFDEPFNKFNAVFWKKNIKEVVPAIMRLTGVSDEGQRIFISYRRVDTTEFADQLFDRLSHEGFEVFLDRFSIEPAVNFQMRLSQELSDKAMVVLLESPTYLQSGWIQYEIDFAKTYRLGLFALNIDNAPKIPTVDDEYRKNITLGKDKRMGDDEMNELVYEIRMRHETALFRKRYNLYNGIMVALNARGASPATDEKGFINVYSKVKKVDYKIWAVGRPADTHDYHLSDSSSNKNEGIIIGPEFIEANRYEVNKWLAGKSRILFFNESQILDLCDIVCL